LSDLAAQPMSNFDRNIWITFNGEIYNHTDLRKELILTGKYIWKTDHSDTEVIVHAYEEWGIDFVNKINGQYAIGIWDSRIKELFLIRDRIGIKPLYYYHQNSKFIFASEIKAILKDPILKREVDEESLYNYFSFLTTPAPKTLFKYIYKLEPGTYLKFKDGEASINKYWDVLENVTDYNNLPENEIIEELLKRIKSAVKSHKMSDVSCGVFLSGGIDSSTNAVLFNDSDTLKINTFTIGYQGNNKSYPNENNLAKDLTESLSGNFYERYLTVEDFLEFFPKMIQLQDEPIADPVCFPVYSVSKLAQEKGVKVCHVGEGADELFFGYSSWKRFNSLNNKFAKFPKKILRIVYSLIKLTPFKDIDRIELLKRFIENKPILYTGAEHPSTVRKNNLFDSLFLKKLENYDSWSVIKPIYENFLSKSKDKSFLNWLSYSDLKFRLPELLLMRVDKMSMGASIETRVPFLDYKVVEFAMSLSTDIKFKNDDSKYLLKRAVKGLIPDNIINRKKQGFGVPMNEWLFDKLGAKIEEDTEAFLKETNFFNKNEILKLLKNKNEKSFMIYNFILWYNHYIKNNN
jgi:asparagine synthase (glutamine-hydrolysing)